MLPTLEHCFLRHSRGLTLLRAFLEQALCGAFGSGLIGCDSWAWAYIQRIWPLSYAHTLTLQAFDAPALSTCLLTRPDERQADVQFLSARTGKPLLPAEFTDPSNHDEGVSRELRRLAADCRGNLGVAWHQWRERLRTSAATDAPDDDAQPDADSDSDPRVWVASETQVPIFLNDSSEEVIFILHALLLHEGLSAEVLSELLPLPHSRVVSRLLELQNTSVLTEQHGVWRVAALAYPRVHDLLRGQSYLCDGF